MNPFERMPAVPDPDELIEIALSRANKVTVPYIKNREAYTKKLLIKKLITSYDYVENKLKVLKEWYKNLEPLDIFYDELLNIIIGKETFRNSIEKIIGIIPTIRKLRKFYVSRIKISNNPRDEWYEAVGRLSSIIKRRKIAFKTLSDARIKLSSLPSLDRQYPLIVVGGPPNVGKSSLVNAISSAKSKVASYPFTTRQIILGHLKTNSTIIQVMDTPGLLDKPLDKRNPIELQAITALKHATTMIIFMLDPSETCGYPIDYQLNVLKSVKELFKTEIIIVLNKIDICEKTKLAYVEDQLRMNNYNDFIEISIKSNINIDKLRKRIIMKCKFNK